MAFAVARSNGTWELRESSATPRGPRSRTLASFRTLTDDVAAHAAGRSTSGATAAELRAAARRAGAPVSSGAADEAAGALLAALARGEVPRTALRRLLVAALDTSVDSAVTDSERAAAAWVGRSPRERAEALHDLLLLADHLPAARPREGRRFPRISSVSP